MYGGKREVGQWKRDDTRALCWIALSVASALLGICCGCALDVGVQAAMVVAESRYALSFSLEFGQLTRPCGWCDTPEGGMRKVQYDGRTIRT